MTTIHWYPGHMAKAAKEIKKQAALCDFILEIGDARLPVSSRNPVLATLIGQKPRLLILNKADLTERSQREAWLRYYGRIGQEAVFLSAIGNLGFPDLYRLLQAESARLHAHLRERSRRPRPLRMMMVGIPNTGKSALLNALAGQKRARTGNQPGLTRALQWVRSGEDWELLDSPGLLWPKLEDQEAALKLAVIGSLSKEGCSEEESGWYLLNWLIREDPASLQTRYKLAELAAEPADILTQIAQNRGLLLRGGHVKEHETYTLLLKEFRAGLLGRHILEKPEEIADA